MATLLLFLTPLLYGIATFFMKRREDARLLALLASFLTLGVSIWSLTGAPASQLDFTAGWMGSLGSSFSLGLDGLGKVLTLLTAVSFPIIFVATWHSDYKRANNFFALMLLTQAGLMGVFTAMDGLLFYFFWELALIPVYFLCSGWGGERRIPVTFKFFIYTFTGSVLMLIGLLYLYNQTPDHSFALSSFMALKLPSGTESKLFWLLFIAFAVKMPVWPLHTWQPDTYEQSPTAVTMVLSGIMVKMGLFGMLRWVLPVVPGGFHMWGNVTMSMGVIGIIYASIIAIRQNDLKRLIAYSSIAHIGLMAMAMFSESPIGMKGLMIQMFSHGVNIIGLWIVVEVIERQWGTRKLSELGGLAQKAPSLAILLVIMAFANVSLPLTNAFIGEFMMFTGIWTSPYAEYTRIFTALAGLGIILSAVYTLTMVQKIFFGATNALTAQGSDIRLAERVALGILVLLVIGFGIFPQPMIDLGAGYVADVFKEIGLDKVVKK